jgi:hypothetical protein
MTITFGKIISNYVEVYNYHTGQRYLEKVPLFIYRNIAFVVKYSVNE